MNRFIFSRNKQLLHRRRPNKVFNGHATAARITNCSRAQGLKTRRYFFMFVITYMLNTLINIWSSNPQRGWWVLSVQISAISHLMNFYPHKWRGFIVRYCVTQYTLFRSHSVRILDFHSRTLWSALSGREHFPWLSELISEVGWASRRSLPEGLVAVAVAGTAVCGAAPGVLWLPGGMEGLEVSERKQFLLKIFI